ncbi:LysR family transcriptional regulator [Vibrio sp. SCSIO 43135]|uniref:LysR substrate-binding domain-containing protein n=1 Tax=Vibrio sp. SCSIO 43135 TaxID=2819096 RepID=UPI0020762EA8|nr:LysR substrate-binding domain-containing protein [Vibrio sp. SCSIO 43135]USD43252.1 LysR family transcriptional regulator [Vibrio sp. SCSIO 43135]
MSVLSNRQQLLSLLHTFSVAAKHLSFTLAANELFLTQGGVSHRIKKLEQQLKFHLFVRKTRRLELTPEGERVLAMLNTSFELIFSELEDIQSGELSGELYIGTSGYFASAWLLPRLSSFRKLYPNLSLKLQTKQNRSDFQFDPYDVAIFYSEGRYPNHHSERLFVGIRTPVCSPEYAKDHGLLDSIDNLRNANFIHSGSRNAWPHWLQEVGLDIDSVSGSDLYSFNEQAIDAARYSMGVALGRMEFVQPMLDSGQLVAPFDSIDSGKGYDLVCPQGMQHRTKFQVFSKWIHSQLDEVGSTE